jgi:hypothetical protein
LEWREKRGAPRHGSSSGPATAAKKCRGNISVEWQGRDQGSNRHKARPTEYVQPLGRIIARGLLFSRQTRRKLMSQEMKGQLGSHCVAEAENSLLYSFICSGDFFSALRACVSILHRPIDSSVQSREIRVSASSDRHSLLPVVPPSSWRRFSPISCYGRLCYWSSRSTKVRVASKDPTADPCSTPTVVFTERRRLQSTSLYHTINVGALP